MARAKTHHEVDRARGRRSIRRGMKDKMRIRQEEFNLKTEQYSLDMKETVEDA